jgi:hypothetical protein
MLRPATQEQDDCARDYGNQQKPDQPSACHADAATHHPTHQRHAYEPNDSNRPYSRQRNQHNVPYISVCHISPLLNFDNYMLHL